MTTPSHSGTLVKNTALSAMPAAAASQIAARGPQRGHPLKSTAWTGVKVAAIRTKIIA
jgi:hypothetical protein